jgi:hypothetical protein
MRFLEFLKVSAEATNSSWDWDEGAGENWATLLKQHTIALVCKEVPFAFIHTDVLQSMAPLCKQNEVSFIAIQDFDKKELFINGCLIAEIFEKDVLELSGFDRVLSANEIWFNTI